MTVNRDVQPSVILTLTSWDMDGRIAQQFTVTDEAIDADVVDMAVNLLLGSRNVCCLEDLRDRILDICPLPEEEVLDVEPEEDVVQLDNDDNPLIFDISVCDGCVEECSDTACLHREDFDY